MRVTGKHTLIICQQDSSKDGLLPKTASRRSGTPTHLDSTAHWAHAPLSGFSFRCRSTYGKGSGLKRSGIGFQHNAETKFSEARFLYSLRPVLRGPGERLLVPAPLCGIEDELVGIVTSTLINLAVNTFLGAEYLSPKKVTLLNHNRFI